MMASFVQSQIFESVKRPGERFDDGGVFVDDHDVVAELLHFAGQMAAVRPMPMMRTDFMKRFLSLIIR